MTLHHRLSHLVGLLLISDDDLALVLTLKSQKLGSVSICLSVACAYNANDDDHANDATGDRDDNPNNVDPPESCSGLTIAYCLAVGLKAAAGVAI